MPIRAADQSRAVEIDQRLQTPQLVDTAGDIAEYLLIGKPERLRHTEAVVEKALLLTSAVADDEAPLLVAAAWLHDIGYAEELRQSGFHPLDGGLYLRDRGWASVMCSLVAHHSGSRYVAAIRGVSDELAVFSYRDDPLSDALTVADQTAGPNGTAMTVNERMTDMLDRHGPNSPSAKAHLHRGPYLLSAAARVVHRLDEAGIERDRHHIL